MTFGEFLVKETPSYGGCMLCHAKYYKQTYDENKHEFVPELRESYMLVEKHKITNGDMYTINGRAYYEYNYAWDEKMPWEILYKKEL